MDRASYEMRREDEKRRFLRFTIPDGRLIYVDRYAISVFGTDLDGRQFIHVDGISTVVQEKISEIKTALGIDCERTE